MTSMAPSWWRFADTLFLLLEQPLCPLTDSPSILLYPSRILNYLLLPMQNIR